jgi:hypothetical protein
MPRLTILVFATHRAFGRKLHQLEGVWPQGQWDDAGNVVHGVLPLGPGLTNVRHRLAHIYVEWIFDHLVHNVADIEPRPAWLYDGLAEVLAQRIAPVSGCVLRGKYPIPISALADPAAWWRVRGTGFASLEYCEAEQAADTIAGRLGWHRLFHDLVNSKSWLGFAHGIGINT